MHANKLIHRNRLFTTIRGVISYLMLMGVWFFYPYIQRPKPELVKAKVRPATDEKVVATGKNDHTFFEKLPIPNHREQKLVKAHPMREFSDVVSRRFGEMKPIRRSTDVVSNFNEIDKINLKSGKFVTENDR